MMTLISAVTINVTTILIATAAPVESSSSDSSAVVKKLKMYFTYVAVDV